MNRKHAASIASGLLMIVCGEASKLNLTHWSDLTAFTYWLGVLAQVAGLLAVYGGGLYQPSPGGDK